MLNCSSPISCPAGQIYFINDGLPVDFFRFIKPLIEVRNQEFPRLEIPFFTMKYISFPIESMNIVLNNWGLSAMNFPTVRELKRIGINRSFSIDKAKLELEYSPKIDSYKGSILLKDLYCSFPNNHFFSFPYFHWWFSVISGMSLLGITAFQEDNVEVKSPLLKIVEFIGLYIFRSRSNLRILFWSAVLTHFIEACYAYKLANEIRLKSSYLWFSQTLILGYPSLSLLQSFINKKST